MFQMNVEFFSSLIPAARENGVTICIENMPMKMLSLSSPTETLRLVRTINDPNVAFCLDTGHSIVMDEQPGAAVRMGAEKLRVLHVHDSDGIQDRHWYPGEGAIDWADFSAALKEVAFDGIVSMEIHTDETLPEEQYRQETRKLASIAGRLVSMTTGG